MKSYDVVILGGGIVGLTAALALSHAGFTRIALVEGKLLQLDDLNQSDQRVSTINPGSQKIFHRLGVWGSMQRVSHFNRMYLWDQAGNGEIEFNAAPSQSLGAVVEHPMMQEALFQAIQSRVDCLMPMRAERIAMKEKNAVLTLSNGERLQADLIVGADGANSWLRQEAGIICQQQGYGQQALVTTVKLETPHQKTAWQCFLKEGPLALLPLVDPHQCSIVWSTSPDQAQQLKTEDAFNFNEQITTIFSEQLGTIEVMKPRITFPLIKRHVPTPFQSRLVLIGDAAHTIHPLAGQGVNLGIGDAYALANTLKIAYQKQRDIGALDTLQRYARMREEIIKTWLMVMDGFHQLFTHSNKGVIIGRSFGLNLANRFPGLKQFFMSVAAM